MGKEVHLLQGCLLQQGLGDCVMGVDIGLKLEQAGQPKMWWMWGGGHTVTLESMYLSIRCDQGVLETGWWQLWMLLLSISATSPPDVQTHFLPHPGQCSSVLSLISSNFYLCTKSLQKYQILLPLLQVKSVENLKAPKSYFFSFKGYFKKTTPKTSNSAFSFVETLKEIASWLRLTWATFISKAAFLREIWGSECGFGMGLFLLWWLQSMTVSLAWRKEVCSSDIPGFLGPILAPIEVNGKISVYFSESRTGPIG